jgi:hypothetical protein
VTIWGRKAGPDDSPKDMDWDTVTLEMDATLRDNPYWLGATTEAIPEGVKPDASAEELTSMHVDQVRDCGMRSRSWPRKSRGFVPT